MFETNFEKKFERATEAFTKAIEDLDNIVDAADLELKDLADKIFRLEHAAGNIRNTRTKVSKVQDKLKSIFDA